MNKRAKVSKILGFFMAGAVCGCASARSAAPARPDPERGGVGGLEVGAFVVGATPPVGTPLFDKPSVAIDESLELKGVVISDGRTRYVMAALDYRSNPTEAYDLLRASLAEAAGVPPSHVAVHCTHTHSAPAGVVG